MSKEKQVAVVGGGTSGLMAIKCLKEEGFEPYCFEKSSYYGGLWKYHEEDIEGVPSVMWSTSLNNSKEIGAISDFPPFAEYPNYMGHQKVYEMFTEYGKKFDLFRHISYNKEVTNVQKADDYNTNGRWIVTIKDTKSSEITIQTFDAVMICIGHLTIPNIPSFPGMKTFRGDIIHTHSIKNFQHFSNKRVCVVGTGSSALDAAVEISHLANQVSKICLYTQQTYFFFLTFLKNILTAMKTEIKMKFSTLLTILCLFLEVFPKSETTSISLNIFPF